MPQLIPPLRVSSVVLATTLLIVTFPGLAHGATRYVASTGTDGPACGVDAISACQSITQAIAPAAPGDTILVGPGRYGDLNRNGVIGDVPGEETGSPGCDCILSIDKHVIVLSSGGAAVTMILFQVWTPHDSRALVAACGAFSPAACHHLCRLLT